LGGLFKVEYINYILIVLAMLLVFIVFSRFPRGSRLANDKMELANTARQRRLKKNKEQIHGPAKDFLSRKQQKSILNRELSKVPTPWGWPRHETIAGEGSQSKVSNGHAHSFSDSFQRWAGKLVHEKHTVDDAEYKRKKEENMRALLEDRYGRSGKTTTMPYEKVKGPLLRDPASPHDQMDNFPSGRVNKIAGQLKQQSQHGGASNKAVKSRLMTRSGLKDMKMPWGW
jgi:hypothetical protein